MMGGQGHPNFVRKNAQQPSRLSGALGYINPLPWVTGITGALAGVALADAASTTSSSSNRYMSNYGWGVLSDIALMAAGAFVYSLI